MQWAPTHQTSPPGILTQCPSTHSMTRSTQKQPQRMAKAQLNHLQAPLPLPSGAVKPVLTPDGISSAAPGSSGFFPLLSPQARTMFPQHQGYHCHIKRLTAGWTLHFPPSCFLQSLCSRNLQNKKPGNIPWCPLPSSGLLFCKFLLQGLCRR